MRAALACILFGSLVACKGGGAAAVKPRGPVGPAIDAKQAEQGASDLVIEIYETLGRGNKDSLFTLLDDSLMVFGPRGGDMLGTRADALVALGQVVDPKAKKTLTIRTGKLEVLPAQGGRSAVAVDAATINGQPHAVMAVLTNSDDLWLVEAVAVARMPAGPQVKAELAKDAVVPPGAAGAKKVDPEARPAVEKFQKGLLDQAAWGDELAGRDDAVVIGPTAGEVTRGKAIKAMWQKRVDAKTRAAVSGEITAAVTDDGQLAWVSAPITRVEGEGTEPMPLRAFAVFARDGADWKLIALSESLAIGDPGAGAPFKKILPPKPVEPKPPVLADKPKDEKDKGKAETAATAKAKAKPEKQKVAVEPPAKKQAKAAEEPPKKTAKAKAEEPKKTAKAKAEEPKKTAKAKTEEPKQAKAEEEPKKKKRRFSQRDDDGEGAEAREEEPKKKKSPKDDEDGAPKKKLAKADADDEDRKKKKKAKAEDDGEAEESKPKPKKVKAAADDEDQPKKKKKKKADDEDQPKKKKKPAADDEDQPKKKKADWDDDDEDQPKKKKADWDDDDDDDQPKKKKKADWDDD